MCVREMEGVWIKWTKAAVGLTLFLLSWVEKRGVSNSWPGRLSYRETNSE